MAPNNAVRLTASNTSRITKKSPLIQALRKGKKSRATNSSSGSGIQLALANHQSGNSPKKSKIVADGANENNHKDGLGVVGCTVSPSKKSTKEKERKDDADHKPLENLGAVESFVPDSDKKLVGSGGDTASVQQAIEWIHQRMWDPIPEKGLSNSTMSAALKYRQSLPCVVTVNQLQALFPSNASSIDRQIVRLSREGRVRRLAVNQIEGGDLLIGSEHYYELCRNAAYHTSLQMVQLGEESSRREKGEYVSVRDDVSASILAKFEGLVRSMPASSTSVTLSDLQDADLASHYSFLVNAGFLTLVPGASQEFALSVPNIGALLRLVSTARKWVKATLAKLPWSEALESDLEKKWLASKAHWFEFRGCRLEWVLFDLAGGGFCEAFSTPVGRGWKLTGK